MNKKEALNRLFEEMYSSKVGESALKENLVDVEKTEVEELYNTTVEEVKAQDEVIESVEKLKTFEAESQEEDIIIEELPQEDNSPTEEVLTEKPILQEGPEEVSVENTEEEPTVEIEESTTKELSEVEIRNSADFFEGDMIDRHIPQEPEITEEVKADIEKEISEAIEGVFETNKAVFGETKEEELETSFINTIIKETDENREEFNREVEEQENRAKTQETTTEEEYEEVVETEESSVKADTLSDEERKLQNTNTALNVVIGILSAIALFLSYKTFM